MIEDDGHNHAGYNSVWMACGDKHFEDRKGHYLQIISSSPLENSFSGKYSPLHLYAICQSSIIYNYRLSIWSFHRFPAMNYSIINSYFSNNSFIAELCVQAILS